MSYCCTHMTPVEFNGRTWPNELKAVHKCASPGLHATITWQCELWLNQKQKMAAAAVLHHFQAVSHDET